MKVEIEVDVPDGWRAVAYRPIRAGEWYMSTVSGFALQAGYEYHEPRIILEKVEQKRHKRTVYINVYQDNGDYYLHSSRKSADVSSVTRCGVVTSDKRIACLELNLDFAEGEGLEP